MKHVIASYLRQVWDKHDWLYEGQHEFRLGCLYESQIITVCQDIAHSMCNGDKIDAVVIDFSKTFVLVPHDKLLIKLRTRAWIRG